MAVIDKTLSNSDYHSTLAIGSTGLKLLKKTPAHFYAQYLSPTRNQREQTPAQLLGSCVHMAFLEKEKFDETYTVLPDGIDRRTKDGKQLYEDILKTGKQPIAEPVWNRIKAMVESAEKLSMSEIFSRYALAEQSMFFTDTKTKAKCKIRPDWHIPPKVCPMFPEGVIIDVKTCGDASIDGFSKNAWNTDMYIQAAFYTMGYMKAYKKKAIRPRFMWLAIETDEPHASQYIECPDFLIDYGIEQVDALLSLYAECLKTKRWPSYPDSIAMLDLPSYAMRVIEGQQDEVEVGYV